MKDNMKNFREAANTILKDIYVTDELERKTLEKCTNKKSSRINFLIVPTASVAVLVVTFGIYNYFSHEPIMSNKYIDNSINNSLEHDYQNSAAFEDPQSPSKAEENKNLDKSNYSPADNEKSAAKPSDNVSPKGLDTSKNNSVAENKNPNNNAIAKNTDTNNPLDNISKNVIANNESKPTSAIPKAPGILTASAPPLNIASAEKYFESKILLPSNIPEGFSLTQISIPDHKLKCIKLNYSSKTNYFEILQNKTLSKLEGAKTISIENNKAYASSIKDEESNIVTTKITWVMNNIEYSLSGNLSEDALINIAKSIK